MGEHGEQRTVEILSPDGGEPIALQLQKSDQTTAEELEKRAIILQNTEREKPAWEYLDDRQRAFVRAYISCGGNIEQATIRSGWQVRTGYSPLSTGRALLEHYYVKKAIREYWDAMHMTPEEVIGRLAQQARNEIMAYIIHDGDGNPKLDTKRLVEEGKSHLIRGLKTDSKGNLNVEVYNAQDALVHIGRSMQMFGDSDKTNVTIGVKRLVGVSEDEL